MLRIYMSTQLESLASYLSCHDTDFFYIFIYYFLFLLTLYIEFSYEKKNLKYATENKIMNS